MGVLNGFRLQLVTGSSSGAKTDGDVYVGLGGREFYVDSEANDFEASTSLSYAYGGSPATGSERVKHAEWNDPRRPLIEDFDVMRNPIYLRFVPRQLPTGGLDRDDNWELAVARLSLKWDGPILAFPDPPIALIVNGPIWLGIRRGQIVHFRRDLGRIPD